MNELEKLILHREYINKKIREIEDAERFSKNADMVGKCYKVENSYSNSDKWWLYTIVHNQLDDGCLSVTQFEICSDGKVDITPLDYFMPYEGHIEITPSELAKEWENTLDYARSMMSEINET